MVLGGGAGWPTGRLMVPPVAAANDPFANLGLLASGGAGLWHFIAAVLGILFGGLLGSIVGTWRTWATQRRRAADSGGADPAADRMHNNSPK
jgi:hypothetical protein